MSTQIVKNSLFIRKNDTGCAVDQPLHRYKTLNHVFNCANIMNMGSKNIKIFYILLLASGVIFYQFYVLTKYILPSKLLEIEQILAGNSLLLIQNRVSLVEIVNLNSSSTLFGEEKNSLLSTISTSNAEGLERLSKVKSISKVIGLPFGHTNFINNELIQELPDLLSLNEEIFERQKGFLKQIEQINSVNKNIYNYNLAKDLGDLELKNEADKIIERTTKAVEGIRAVNENLKSLPQTEKSGTLSNNISETISMLEQLNQLVLEKNALEAGKLFDKLVIQFDEMRKLALQMEISIIQSDEMIQLLTDQTNLILKYQFLREKTDNLQGELAESVLSEDSTD